MPSATIQLADSVQQLKIVKPLAGTVETGKERSASSTESKLATTGQQEGLRLPTWRSPLPVSKPYVLEAEQGKTLAVVGSGSIMRFLATGQETDDAFAVVQTRGRTDEVVQAQSVWVLGKQAAGTNLIAFSSQLPS